MRVSPILFSGPMVRALIDGRKTQTRRLLSPENLRIWSGGLDFPGKNIKWPKSDFADMLARNARGFRVIDGDLVVWETDPAPWQGGAGVAAWQGRLTYSPGDVLWVRETCSGVESHDGLDCVRYEADQVWLPIENTSDAAERWLDLHHYGEKRGANVPSIHMPRWASRITLVVTGVKVERLQDISDADANAEGCGLYVPGHGFITHDELVGDPGYSNFLAPRMGFEAIWSEINGQASWEENPWVTVVSFRPHLINVDAFLAQREAA
jgi:hypothetical protein